MKQDRMLAWYLRACVLPVMLAPALVMAEEKKESTNTVSSGKEVSLEYTLKLAGNKVVDTNVGQDPLTYTQGSGQLISGLESKLEGMAVGETKQVTVVPEDGYGSVNPQAFQEVPKENIPAEAMKVGTELIGRDAQGRVVRPRVSEIKDKTVVLDFNHPLAGQTLYFDVKVLDVK